MDGAQRGWMFRVTVLILGGVREGRDLAARLTDSETPVITSLAGRVASPAAIAGEVRVGGFGGVDGMAGWLRRHDVAAVVDATHPFAERISANAAAACRAAGVPLLRLQRPSWADHPDAATWVWVDDAAQAAREAAGFSRILLTVGRQRLGEFASLADRELWARMVELPETSLPEAWHSLLDRGPFTVEGELELLRRLEVDCLVTKDSGGTLTEAKLTAARELGVTVVAIRRAPAPEGVTTVSDVSAAEAWVHALGKH